MGISLTPDPLSPVNRGQQFSITISGTEDTGGQVTKMSGTILGNLYNDSVTITPGTSSVTVSGKYESIWQDKFNYVEANESDKTDTTKTAITTGNMPPEKNLYQLIQDMSATKTITYNISIEYTDMSGVASSTSASLDHVVMQNWEGIHSFMATYKYNGTGAKKG